MSSLKIALSGYGKMGKEVEKALLDRNHQVVLVLESAPDWDIYQTQLTECDVVIDFSLPTAAVANILRCFEAGIPIVCGTTGWAEQLSAVKQSCIEGHHSLFYAANFSVSVNLFFEINRLLAKLMNRLESYEVNIEEIHHLQKLDSPSGTAITLANDIIANMERKEKWQDKLTGQPEEIGIKSIRQDNVPGTHNVTYESPIDSIMISHTAKNRRGFAQGAVMAAEFLHGKKGFFGMQNLLHLND